MAQIFNMGAGGGGSKAFKLDHINIINPPSKIIYKSGEMFIPDGIVVQAVYANGATLSVTDYSWSPTILTDDVEKVTIYYTENRVTKTAEQRVTVIPVLSSIAVTRKPDKMDYVYLDTFKPSGMEVTAYYTDGSSKPATGYVSQTPTFNRTGEYPVEISYTDDGVTKTTTLTINVGRASISATPSQRGTVVYNGEMQTPEWDDYDPAKLDISGEVSASAPGLHTVTFTPTEYYQWSDGTVTGREVQWEIKAITIVTVPYVSGTLTYTGGVRRPSWVDFDQEHTDISGETDGIDARTYTATFTLHENCEWETGGNAPKQIQWVINRASISVPTLSGTLTYTGKSQSPKWTGYDANKMTWSGDTAAIDAGNYNAKFTPTSNYQWTDTTITAKTVSWSIAKAPGSLSVDPESLTLNSSELVQTISVTRAGDGKITATSNAPDIAEVSVNNTTITVTGKANGPATITVSVAEGTNHFAPTNKTVAVTVSMSKIYGVRWSGGPGTTMSRTDEAEGFTDPVPFLNDGQTPGSSPFDGLQPWAGMQRVTDPVLGELVSIPKYWYKWTKSGAVMTLRISNGPQDGFSVSPAHADRGDGRGERNVVYVGRYHCSETDYKSVSGQIPKTAINRATARDEISKLDTTAWQYDFAMFWTIRMLYIVEFANWDSQRAIGYGCGSIKAEACGASDAMGYHTGTMQESRSTYGVGCQYRWIEGLWDNVCNFVDGIRFSSADIYCFKNPSDYNDDAGGTKTGTRPTTSQYIKAWGIPTASGFNWALYPSEVLSNVQYVSDYCSYISSSVAIRTGGSFSGKDMYRGLFYLVSTTASQALADTGCRLQKLP